MRMQDGTGEPNSTESRAGSSSPTASHGPMKGNLIKSSEPLSLGAQCLALNKQDRPGGLHQQRY